MKQTTTLLSLLLIIVTAVNVRGLAGYTPVFLSRVKPVYSGSKTDTMTMRARNCDLLGKSPNRQARVVTFSHTRNKKVQEVNLQTKRFFSDRLKRNVKLRLSTKGIKTVNKMDGSIDAAAKKFGIDLSKF